ncbi:MAG: methylamine utilization protein MauG, partial [Nitrosomonas sp. PRO5]|nr:methylamine utilization protein MauG [Nitrosomonas sp. PRO5]
MQIHLRSVVLPVLALISFSSQAADSLNNEQKLGEHLFKDANLSLNRNQSCATCHSLNP